MCRETLQREAFRHEVESLTEQVVALRAELDELREQKAEADKEQEDVSPIWRVRPK